MFSRLWAPLQPEGPFRRRGGWRMQQAAEGSATDQVVTGPSILACGSLLSWGDGDTSSIQVVRTASHAVRDGLSHPMVRRLASCGEAHANAALKSLLQQETCVLDTIKRFEVAATRLSSTPTHWIPPSALYTTMFIHYPTEFAQRLGADTGRLKSFWRQWRSQSENSAELASHPHLSTVREDMSFLNTSSSR